MTTLRLSHRKNEKCELKKYVKVVSVIIIIIKVSSNK
jgi:hypothetical protein